MEGETCKVCPHSQSNGRFMIAASQTVAMPRDSLKVCAKGVSFELSSPGKQNERTNKPF
jgi:hypothetical protein